MFHEVLVKFTPDPARRIIAHKELLELDLCLFQCCLDMAHLFNIVGSCPEDIPVRVVIEKMVAFHWNI